MPNLTVDPKPDLLTSSDPVSVNPFDKLRVDGEQSRTINPSSYNLPKSILIGILIFVLLSATAYGAYWYGQSVVTTKLPPSISPFTNTPTPKPTPVPVDETASWKTYTNPMEKYSLNYPSNWTIAEQTGDGESGIILKTFDLKFEDYSHVSKGALIYGPYFLGVVAGTLSLDDLFTKLNQSSVGNKIVLEETNTTLDGQPSKKRVFREDASAGVQVVFQYPKTIDAVNYSFIVLISGVKDFDASKQAFDQILSTFKFL